MPAKIHTATCRRVEQVCAPVLIASLCPSLAPGCQFPRSSIPSMRCARFFATFFERASTARVFVNRAERLALREYLGGADEYTSVQGRTRGQRNGAHVCSSRGRLVIVCGFHTCAIAA